MAHLSSKSKTAISFATLFFFFFFFISVLSTGIDDDDAAYLFKLRDAFTPAPSDWLNNKYMCEWSGVSCGLYTLSNTPYVEGISLSSMSPTGTLPSGLDSLVRLTKVDLYNNSLSGPLPSLAYLTFLKELDLSSNNFTSIPDGCFRGLTDLQLLRLSDNTNLATWTFPSHLTHSTLLENLNLDATNLMGSLPDIFGSFPELDSVYLYKNKLAGVLPKSFAGSKVTHLWLHDQEGDGLSGTIEVLSSMTHLYEVQLQGNSFEGPIPDLSNCTNLKDLQLHNRLTGVVPHSLSSLRFLIAVSLDNNFLQGPVPLFDKDVNVIIGVNSTNGFCRHDPGPCDQRVTILLEIAAAFGYPYQLARSWQGNNPCKGWSFITCEGNKIRTVNLTRQNLTGTISPEFCYLADLRHLYLDGNNLMGSIPKSLAALPQLKAMDVSNNNLSRNIPMFSPAVNLTTTGNAFLGNSQANRTTPPADSGRRPSPFADSDLIPSPTASKT